MLQSVLNLKFVDEATILDTLQDWGRLGLQYEQQSDDVISDSVKKAVLATACAEAIRHMLHLQGRAEDTYEDMRNNLRDYVLSKRSWQGSGAMEVDAFRDNRGKGHLKGPKGDSKGKGDSYTSSYSGKGDGGGGYGLLRDPPVHGQGQECSDQTGRGPRPGCRGR